MRANRPGAGGELILPPVTMDAAAVERYRPAKIKTSSRFRKRVRDGLAEMAMPALSGLAEASIQEAAGDLEYMGMHEVKRHFPQFFSALQMLSGDVPPSHLLGKFALFYSSYTRE